MTQIKSAQKAKHKGEDPWYQVMLMGLEKPEWVRHVGIFAGDPSVCCFSDNQLMRLDAMAHETIFLVDMTFDAGDFWLINTAHEHVMLHSKQTESCPWLLGPVEAVKRKDTASYDMLFYYMKLRGQQIGIKLDKSVKYTGSDDEKPLNIALKKQFPEATELACIVHFRRNVSDKLVGFPQDFKNMVMGDIFGKDGLLNSADEIQFDERLVVCCATWDEEERNITNAEPTFSAYIRKYKAEKMKSEMLIKVYMLYI